MLRSLPLQLLAACSCLALALPRTQAQTIVLNEVSNGPSGSMEYLELLVVPDGPLEPCTPPTCLDLRGWMFDDNNGYHGSGGEATGAARFASNALWSCVPVGTLIVIYNDGDPNTSLPPIDASLSDGNCSIVVPSGNAAYFEYTNTTPAPVLCDYPGGWGNDPAPTWQSNLALANTGDCIRLADMGGCEVFSLCYGNVSQNASVHFPGNGADRVWSFTTGDPFSAAAWIQGCAGDIATCGADDQTPGAPNNAANAAWMAQFNNGCTTTTVDPVTVSATATGSCSCNGTATAVASGSTAPYAFVWYDAAWASIGQDQANAADLCDGTYHVIVTSATGCIDTATVVVNALSAPDAGTGGSASFCSDEGAIDLFTLLTGTPDAGGTWSPTLPGGAVFDPSTDPSGPYTYTVSGAPGCTPAVATIDIQVNAVPVPTVTIQDELCDGAGGSIELTVLPAGNYTITWNGGLPDGPSQQDVTAGNYTATVTGPGGCSAAINAVVEAGSELTISSTSTPATCGTANGSACVTVNGGVAPYTVSWNDPTAQDTDCATALEAGTYTATISDANGCTASVDVIIAGTSSAITVSATIDDVRCAGGSDGRITLQIDPPADYAVQWNGPGGFEAEGMTIEDLFSGDYSFVVSDVNGCSVNGTGSVDEPGPMVVSATSTATSCADLCDGSILVDVQGGVQPWAIVLDVLPVGDEIEDLCAGTYVLTVQDAQGCERNTTVTVDPGAGSVSPVLTGPTSLCADADAVLLTATPAGGTWSGPGVSVDGVFDPMIAGPAVHVLTYSLNCAAPTNITVEVAALPQARFVLPLDDGLVVQNISIAATNHRWWVNDVFSGDQEDLTLSSSTIGADAPVVICLAAFNAWGCSDTTCTVFARPVEPSVYVPNAFTPNADTFNDGFYIAWAGSEPSQFELIIADRWGRQVFVSTDRNLPWDGTSSGTELPIGVYVWRLQALVQDRTINKMGHVTLVR